MTKTTYHKLVRDNIPEIIRAEGRVCVTSVLTPEDYILALDAKLEEELSEYLEEPCLEELADLMEVIRAAAVAHGYTLEELERVRAEKKEKRGGFEKRICLEETA